MIKIFIVANLVWLVAVFMVLIMRYNLENKSE